MKKVILSACNALAMATNLLNELDEGCGDGDTGTTLACGTEGWLLAFIFHVSLCVELLTNTSLY